MTRQIRFNAFDMNCVGHQSPGLWAHPRDRSWQYKDLEYWTELAATLERGIFDGIFIADVIGYYDVYKGSNYHAIHQAAQIPVNDPLQLVAADRHGDRASRHRHHGVDLLRAPLSPSPAACRPPTICTKGRVGWNIVTSYLESGAKNIGQGGLRRHDNRYEVAEEYVEVLYKLFEGSWEEGAVVRDREQRIFTHPEKVHEIGHKGKYFEVPGYHLCEPSPQRTPLLYQAGASGPGKSFAARHAESVFVARADQGRAQELCRRRAAPGGRGRPRSAQALHLQSLHRHRRRDRRQGPGEVRGIQAATPPMTARWSSCRAGAASTSASTRRPTWSRRCRPTPSISVVEHLAGGDKAWTIEELARWGGIGGLGPVFVGSPTTIADILQEWVEETDVDGFNLAYAVTHETFEDIVNFLVPELQRRGVYPTAYGPRERCARSCSAPARICPSNHPAAAIATSRRSSAKKLSASSGPRSTSTSFRR